jgi:tetratricopeptide (TPR) repeat protein
VIERVGSDELRVELLWQRAWALSFAGRAADAVATGRRGLAIAERTFGEQHPLVAELWSVVSASEVEVGALDDAERDGRKALAIASALYVEDNDRRARIAENLTAALDAEGKYDEAISLEQYALRVSLALGGEEDPNTAIVRQNLGALLLDGNRAREAIPLLEASREALDRDPSQHDAVWAAYTLTGLGRAYVADGQAARAVPLLERAVNLAREKNLDPDVAGESQYRLAVALAATHGDPRRVMELAESGLAEMRKVKRLRKLAEEATEWIDVQRKR